MKKKGFVVGIISMALVMAVFFTSCSSGPKIINLKKFPASDAGNFELYLDWNTTLKTINGEPPKNASFWATGTLWSKTGNLIKLPAGEHTIEVDLDWTVSRVTTATTYTHTWENYDSITIQATFLPNKVYDLQFNKVDGKLFYQIKTVKGEVSWAQPQENETELFFPSKGFDYFVYFNDDEEYALSIQGQGLRYFIPNGNHTVYIRQGGPKYIWAQGSSNRRNNPMVRNKTNRQGVSDDLYRSTPISFTANGEKLKFKVNVCDPNDLIPKKIKLKL